MVWGNVLLVLDLGLDVVDGVGGLDLVVRQKRRIVGSGVGGSEETLLLLLVEIVYIERSKVISCYTV